MAQEAYANDTMKKKLFRAAAAYPGQSIREERGSMEQKNGGKAFQPYIPPEKNQPELTTASVIVGILLAILAVAGIDRRIDLSGLLDTGIIGSAAAILIITAGVLWFARGKEKME